MPDLLPHASTPAQRVLGCRLYNQIGLCATSYRDWFAEGGPDEWVRALEAIQKVLSQCKHQAQQAAREDRATPATPGEALPLFAREGDPRA